jgi:hypothetical protein
MYYGAMVHPSRGLEQPTHVRRFPFCASGKAKPEKRSSSLESLLTSLFTIAIGNPIKAESINIVPQTG